MLQYGVLILHDNVRPYIRATVVALLEKYGWEHLKLPPLVKFKSKNSKKKTMFELISNYLFNIIFHYHNLSYCKSI